MVTDHSCNFKKFNSSLYLSNSLGRVMKFFPGKRSQ